MYLEGFGHAIGGRPSVAGAPERRFQEITAQAPDHIVAQLVGRDRVHRFGAESIEALRFYRLGGNGFDKTCYAIMEEDTVHSAIYVAKGYDPITSDRDYSGNVADILAHKAEVDSRAPLSFIFYSISNITNVLGVGRALVSELHVHMGQCFEQVKASTLSPLRTFDQGFTAADRERFITLPVPEQKKLVLQSLLTGENTVEKFHLENGARIADIKLCTGDKSFDEKTGVSCSHLAMVNYAYDVSADILHKNQNSFVAVKKALRDKDMPMQERQGIVSRGIFARVSRELLDETAFASGMRSSVRPHAAHQLRF